MSTVDRHTIAAVYYATRDGQSRRIAEHISRRLAESEISAPARDIAAAPPPPSELAAAAAVIVVAAVRYGRHLPEADRFLAAYRALPSPPPLALASVNLTARKAGKTTIAGNVYLRKAIARHRLEPAVAVAFAGRLDYRLYGALDRQIIRFIMLLTGGPTDPDARIEYTSWPAVDAFAASIVELIRRRNAPPGANSDSVRA
ncbi:MAG TPA: flavodoxin domain-containing protein [Xanthobacteraceae bacterium]|nr:flavodoxin domain-containing protein [Xanthobacteraceae bacterium]